MPEGDNYGDLREGLKRIKRRRTHMPTPTPTPTPNDFQKYCWDWLKPVFGGDDSAYLKAISREERARRFGEEAIELLQAAGLPKSDVLQLVDYVYSRPVGDEAQEVGGTMVTLASLCEALCYNMTEEGWKEIHRCYQPEIMEKIRNKQISKMLHGIGGSPVQEV